MAVPGPLAWCALVIDRRWRTVLTVALLLALIGGGLMLVPASGTDPTPVPRSETVGFHLLPPAAVNASDNGSLRHGLDGVYLRSHVEDLAGELRYHLDAGPPSDRVDVDLALTVEARRSGGVVWRYTTPLANRTATDIDPGEMVRVSVNRSVSWLGGTLDRLEATTGVAPTRTHLTGRVTRVDASGARRTFSDRVRVELADRTLGLYPDDGDTYQVRPRERATPWWAPLTLGGGLAGMGAVAGCRLLGRSRAVDPRRLRERARRWRYRRHLLPVTASLAGVDGHPVAPRRLLRLASRHRRPALVDPDGRLVVTLDGDRYVAHIAAEG